MHTGDYVHHGFDAMGTRVNFWIDRAAGHRARVAILTGEKFIRDFDRRLSRFNPESELNALNSDPAETVAVSSLLLRLVEAATEAARVTGGLCDPTLVRPIEAAGYRESRAGLAPEPLADALVAAPRISPAAPDPAARWRQISCDAGARTVTRPPGVLIDSGGCGKGLAADMLAGLWRGLLPESCAFIIDCGGDMRLGDLEEGDEPYAINVETVPAQPQPLELNLRGGGVATSGIGSRLWRSGEAYGHHLIDPSTGRPAWTGVASATATGPTALAAETAAKAALLSAGDEQFAPRPPFEQLLVGFAGDLTHKTADRQEAPA